MKKIAAKKKKLPSKSSTEMKELMTLVKSLSETSQSHNVQLVKELAGMREDLSSIRSELSKRINERTPRSSVRNRLFGRSRPEPVIEQQTPKLSINMEDVLPLLPQLGGVLPQLSNPKVAEAMKMLSNPVVMSMIQQFLQGNMGLLKQTNAMIPQNQRRRTLL